MTKLLNLAVAALGGLVYALVQLALLLAGVVGCAVAACRRAGTKP